MHRAIPLHAQTKDLVCAHIERLWGHAVELVEIAEEDRTAPAD